VRLSTKCSRCQHESEADARFCHECGSALAPACEHCGHQLSATARFCSACGGPTGSARFGSPVSYTPRRLAERILESRERLAGERKQVTVLFADLKSSTELLANRDPEEARALIDPVLERMMAAVHRYEGTVNQVMGDGIMALFGAPLAHEDHAVRACYAALDMHAAMRRWADEARRAHGIAVEIRVGLNSGEVVVRAIGSDLHMDYTAVGQTTHVAARIEQLAGPGRTCLTASTLRLAEGAIEVRALGPTLLKGLGEPIDVYELTGAGPLHSRFHAAAARGLTRFVGRTGELEQLEQILDTAAGGQGQVVAIVGGPGVGKSRLVWEVTRSPRVHDWRVLDARAVSYGATTSYLPVVALLKHYVAIEDRDGPHAVREKLAERLRTLDRTLESHLSALLALLDVPTDDAEWAALDPLDRRRRTLAAVSQLLLRESQTQPVLVVVEDLQWIDESSQAVLDALVDSLAGSRVLLLVNYRPEYQHRWGARMHCTQLRLDALPHEHAEQLLGALLGSDPGLEPLTRTLVSRTEGNPFFIEESVRALVEIGSLTGERGAYRLARPLPSIQVPATVQAVLAARIDRLPPADKALLQTAAVVGKDVPLALLRAVADLADDQLHAALARLQAAEFLYETWIFPDREYTFRHALTHDVAYGGLLQDRRRALDGRIVETLERLYPDRLAEHVERLAFHALRGERWEQALRYSRQGGAKAFDRSANREAVAAFEQVLTALAHLSETPETLAEGVDVRLLLRSSLLQLGELERASRHLAEAERLATTLGDRHRLAWLGSYLTTTLMLEGETLRAIGVGEKAYALADEVGDVGACAAARAQLGHACREQGDLRRAVTIFGEAIDLLPGPLVHERFGRLALPPAIYSRAMAALCLAELGDFGEAERLGTEAAALTQGVDVPFAFALTHTALANVYVVQERLDEAMRALEPAVEVVTARGIPIPWAVALRGYVLALAGRADEGCAVLDRALQRAVAIRFFLGHAQWVGYLAHAHLLGGRIDDARRVGDEALRLSRQRDQRAYEAWALSVLGEVEARRGGSAPDAGPLYHEALVLAEALGMRPLARRCRAGLESTSKRP
jgi:class 3 adenylate cyclase/tetratricopeptide (TPR) repeat protein